MGFNDSRNVRSRTVDAHLTPCSRSTHDAEDDSTDNLCEYLLDHSQDSGRIDWGNEKLAGVLINRYILLEIRPIHRSPRRRGSTDSDRTNIANEAHSVPTAE